MAGETPHFEWTHRDAEGRDFPCEVRLLRIEIGDRPVVRGSVTDISERKLVDDGLREREERLRAALSASGTGTFRWDIRTNALNWDEALDALFGLPKGQTVRSLENFIRTVHPDDRPGVIERCERCAKEGEDFSMEFRVIWPDGSLHWLDDRGKTFFDEAGTPLYMTGACVEITERIRAEEALRESEERLRQSQKLDAIGQLAGGVAHDFNNILAAMMMQTELSLGSPDTPKEVREGLSDIRSYCERASELVRQLLLFSRRQIMQPRELDLNESVTHLAKMLQRIIGEDVHLQLNLHPTQLNTRVDSGMLDQVLLNLAVNARDAMPQGGRLRIETSELILDEQSSHIHPDAKPGRYVSISVSDTGCGIPPDILPRIFEPFYTTKEQGKGTGLGLATVFGIVKQHDGWVTVTSELGQGANFSVFLPASQPSAALPQGKTVQPMAQGGDETILLVEDEPGVRMLTRRVLEKHKYHVIEASNGVEALELWKQHRDKVSMLLTDMVMPGGLNGQQLALQLLAEQPNLRVTIMSGYSAETAGQELDEQSKVQFLEKPFTPVRLLEVVRHCLDN